MTQFKYAYRRRRRRDLSSFLSYHSSSSSPLLSPLLLFLLLLLFCFSFSFVAGGDVNDYYTQSTTPDINSLHTLLILIFFLLCCPLYTFSLYHLYHRRSQYPLAGRGSNYLIYTNIIIIASLLLLFFLHLFYADHSGIPCGVLFLVASTSVLPLSYCYMIRGWILVFPIRDY